MDDEKHAPVRWKNHPVSYTWTSGAKTFSFGGRLCSRLADKTFLVDWDDGSTVGRELARAIMGTFSQFIIIIMHSFSSGLERSGGECVLVAAN
jgi:hypothetical protein